MDADVIIVGAGLAGLVAARELTTRGKKVLVIDQENRANLGAQAHWSLGGLFFVDSPEQRRFRVKDSYDLALRDWFNSAQFDRPDSDDAWAIKWATAYVQFATEEKRSWLESLGVEFLPTVGWAERGSLTAGGHGNSVPRFHICWGSGPGIVKPFAQAALHAESAGTLEFKFRHQVDELLVHNNTVTGVRGSVLAHDSGDRGVASNREVTGHFEFTAQAVLVATGGIGGNHELVRQYWPQHLGSAPKDMLTGVPAHVDGRMLDIAARAGAALVNRDRMWHYTEGLHNWNPIWPSHAIRIIPGPSSLWFDALGNLLPSPCYPGYDTISTLKYLRTTPTISQYSHSWFILNQRTIAKEFILSGSEQNPLICAHDRAGMIKERLVGAGAPAPVAAFQEHGVDFVTADTVEDLVQAMNTLQGEQLLNAQHVRSQIENRDAQVDNPFSKDQQIQGIHNSRRFLGDRLARTVKPHRLLDPHAGPLIGIRLHVLTRKTLGGVQTDLSSQAIGANGSPLSGLYAAGEVAGFGGGGVHGYNALEGTFLGGCLFSGLQAGRGIAHRL